MVKNGNLSIETTRKKALEIMQKGMIAYKLGGLGWDISEHYGDGYDLIGMKTINLWVGGLLGCWVGGLGSDQDNLL